MKKNKKIIIFIGILFISYFWVFFAEAAILSVKPNIVQQNVGSVFNVDIIVSSLDQPINVVSGEISFDASVLDALSVSKNNSIINLWVQEPSFSNANGYIRFEGVILNPGYVGGSGKVLSISFKAKKLGVIKLLFLGASVLANDGEGTDVLTGLTHGNVNVIGEITPLSTTTKNQIIATPPTTKLKVTTTTKQIIDSKIFNEKLLVKEIERENTTNPNVKFEIKVLDDNWGLDYFEIILDGAKKIIWHKNDSNIFLVPILKPGGHIIEVNALNKEGEVLNSKKGFVIKPLHSPVWKYKPIKINFLENILLEGTTDYPFSEVKIMFRKKINNFSLWGFGEPMADFSSKYNNFDVENYLVIADDNGDFKLDLTKKLSAGTYFVSAYVVDNNGGVSYATNEEVMQVLSGAIWENEKVVFFVRNIAFISIIIFMSFLTRFLCSRYKIVSAKRYKLIQKDEDFLLKEIESLSKKIDKHIKNN